PHVTDQGSCLVSRKGFPVSAVVTGITMPCRNQRYLVSNTSVGQRKTAGSCTGGGSRNTRNNFYLSSGGAQRQHLLTTTAKHKRVTAFQTHNGLVSLRIKVQQFFDFGLRDRMMPWTFAHIYQHHVRSCSLQKHRVNQSVVNNDVSALNQTQSFDADQVRISRTCSNQPYPARRMFFRGESFLSCIF